MRGEKRYYGKADTLIQIAVYVVWKGHSIDWVLQSQEVWSVFENYWYYPERWELW